jgi:hypothetical protein
MRYFTHPEHHSTNRLPLVLTIAAALSGLALYLFLARPTFSSQAQEQAKVRTVYFLRLDLGAEWQTSLSLTNTEDNEAQLTLTAHDQRGAQLGQLASAASEQWPARLAQRTAAERITALTRLAPGVKRTLDLDDLPPATATLTVTANGEISGHTILQNRADGRMIVLPALKSPAPVLYFPALTEADAADKTITLFNPSDSAANAELIAFNHDGAELARQTLPPLGAAESRTVKLAELFGAYSLQDLATVRVISDADLVGFQLMDRAGLSLLALPALIKSGNEEKQWRAPALTAPRTIPGDRLEVASDAFTQQPQLAAAQSSLSAKLSSIDPLPSGTLTFPFLCDGSGNYCKSRNANDRYVRGHIHTGLDLDHNHDGTDEKNNVLATLPGVLATAPVVDVTCSRTTNSACKGLGNRVVLEHLLDDGSRKYSLYGHLLHMSGNAQAGGLSLNNNRVVGGQFLGHKAQTGFALGTHLHFEINHSGGTASTSGADTNQCAAHWTPGCQKMQRQTVATGSTQIEDPAPFRNGQKRVLLPYLSPTKVAPNATDYEVYGFANQPLNAAFTITPTQTRTVTNIGAGGRPYTADTPNNDIFNVASTAFTANQARPFQGSRSNLAAGDYRFFVYVQTSMRGYPLKFAMLPNANSKIVDNDSRTGYAENSADGAEAAGYYLSAKLFKGGNTTNYAEWRPALTAGKYEVWVHVPPGATAQTVSYSVFTDGVTSTAAAANHATNNDKWVKLGDWNFTNSGYVQLSNATIRAIPTNQRAGADAIKFVHIGAVATFAASGRAVLDNGAGISGVTINFTRVTGTGAIPAAVQTDGNGNWSQSGFEPGTTYRTTPSKTAFTFAPSSRDFSAASTGLNFTGSTTPATTLPTVTSSLTISPAAPYTVGQTLTARFTITNRGDAPIAFSALLVGGRLNGDQSCQGGCPDFTSVSHTLNAGQPYSYTGTHRLTRPGTYDFFVAYRRTDGTWVTNLPVAPGVTNSVRLSVTNPVVAPRIDSINPTVPVAGSSNQPLRVNGANFLNGLSVLATLPNGQRVPLSGAQIEGVTANSFTLLITLGGAGSWRLQVINPGAAPNASNDFSFNVQPPPKIISLAPATPAPLRGDQRITVNGEGFQTNLAVTVTFPNGGTGTLSGAQQIQNVAAARFEMLINFNGNPGNYRLQARNPDGRTSASFPFTVR